MHPWHRSRYSFLQRLLIAVLLAGLLGTTGAGETDWRWTGVSRVVAISDVHGAYDAFLRTLQASKLVDEEARWSGADSHLVVTGDLLDRGGDSRRVMDLLIRLETEAAAADGRVHVLLGNHEVMNLVGDLRYVAADEYAAFADEESADERELWFRRFLGRAADDVDPEIAREQFERARPPGFFAHRRAFREDGYYGKWLLGKPLVIVINGTAFVHGGLSPMAERLGLAGMNGDMGAELAAYVSALGTLVDAALLHPGDGFYAHTRILAALPEDPSRPADIVAAIATVSHPPETSIHQADGPLWYRGQVGCPAIVEAERLTPVLQALDAERVVVGHTPTASRSVVTRLDGRIVEIDTGMLQSYYKGSGHALLMQQDQLSVIDETGAVVPVTDDPRLTGSGPWTAAQLESFFEVGEVELHDERPDGVYTATVTLDEHKLDALFYRAAGRNRHPEVAAYRLDRLLGVDMVPVTIRRTVNGKDGALQLLPSRLTDEATRAEMRAGGDAWCPLPSQWSAMYLFDALIQQPGRNGQQLMYDQANWRLVLAGHGDAFGTRGGRPAYLKNAALNVSGAWRQALAGLSKPGLEELLGDVLDARRQKALLRRRDELLESG
jgi:Calcineurin-like phosphoesterase